MLTVAPGAKPLPLMVNVCAFADPVIGLGLSVEITGGGGAVTVSVAAFDHTLPGFTTCTVQARAVVPTVTVAAICVALDDATVGLTTVPPE
jgi:hypothetical protein